jgi:hypothetical protein
MALMVATVTFTGLYLTLRVPAPIGREHRPAIW